MRAIAVLGLTSLLSYAAWARCSDELSQSTYSEAIELRVDDVRVDNDMDWVSFKGEGSDAVDMDWAPQDHPEGWFRLRLVHR